jgi:hypothetical protein
MAASDSDTRDSGKGQFDREKSDEILHRQFADRPVGHGINPEDGLPTPIPEGGELTAPPLTHDLFVCLADERDFVLRDKFGYELHSFPPEVVNFAPNGKFWVRAAVLKTRLKNEQQEILRVLRAAIDPQIELNYLNEDTPIVVTPRRERCRYLVEMVQGLEGNHDRINVTRLCQLRHDDAGDLMSLRDEMVVACTGRSPNDFVSTDRLRKINAKSLAAGEKQFAAGGIFDIHALDAVDVLEGVLE